jgi:sugar (pentulose or hexulose) kinase
MPTTPPQNLAVADFGKTHTRIKILSPQGKFLTGTKASSTTFRAADGSLDVSALQQWCEDALAGLYWEQPFTHLLPVTHGATAVALRADGSPLPVQDYEAPIAAEVSEAYEKLRSPFSLTGSPPLPCGLNLGRQLYALQRNDQAFAESQRILTYPQYWTWRWSGAAGTDTSSLGCHTDLWQPSTNSWSSLARHMKWDQKFPSLIRAGDIAGPLHPTMAHRIQARHPVSVHWGVHDSNAALAAFLDRPGPFTLLSTGTWLVAFTANVGSLELDAARDNLWMVDVRDRPVACARFMAGREREQIAGNAPLADRSALLSALLGTAVPLPSFAPGGPFPRMQGRIIGPAPGSEMERAALASLYLALMTDATLDPISKSGPLIVEGPLADDEAALIALAALRPNQPLYVTSAQCVALGAARLVFGNAAIPMPELRLIAPDPHIISLINPVRRQWRQSIDEVYPS